MQPSYQGATRAKPVQGSVFLPALLDFTNVVKIAIDLTREINQGVIDFVQSIYIDNADNDNPVIVTFTDYLSAGYRVKAAANSQGWYPVIMPKGKLGFIATTTEGVKVYTTLANCVMEYQQWGPVKVNVAQVLATFTPTPMTLTKDSGNTTANTSTELFAANAGALRRIVMNPPTNAESIYIEFQNGASSAASYPIAPGGMFDTGTGPIDQSQWNIYSVDQVPYIAYEGA